MLIYSGALFLCLADLGIRATGRTVSPSRRNVPAAGDDDIAFVETLFHFDHAARDQSGFHVAADNAAVASICTKAPPASKTTAEDGTPSPWLWPVCRGAACKAADAQTRVVAEEHAHAAKAG